MHKIIIKLKDIPHSLLLGWIWQHFNDTTIVKINGCNYYSVTYLKEFKYTTKQQFEYVINPLLFNVSLKLKCNESLYQIEKMEKS